MNLVKKMVSCGLALSLALGGICGLPRVSAENASISTEQKIAGSVSAVGGIGLLAGIGIGAWHHYHNLPVLIIGGDKDARTKLIDKLKNPEPLTNKDASGETLTSAIEKKTAEGVKKYCVKGTGETRAQFKNWNISQCDVSDAKAADLMKKARLVIVLLKDAKDAKDVPNIGSLISTKKTSCIVAGVVDLDLLGALARQNTLPDVMELCSIGFTWNSSSNTFLRYMIVH